MRCPDWLGRLMIWLGFDMAPALLCECGREIDIEGLSGEEAAKAHESHDRFFHPERVVREEIGKTA